MTSTNYGMASELNPDDIEMARSNFKSNRFKEQKPAAALKQSPAQRQQQVSEESSGGKQKSDRSSRIKSVFNKWTH